MYNFNSTHVYLYSPVQSETVHNFWSLLHWQSKGKGLSLRLLGRKRSFVWVDIFPQGCFSWLSGGILLGGLNLELIWIVWYSAAHTGQWYQLLMNKACHKLKRCLLLGRKAMTNLDSILKSRDITSLTKFCIVKAIIFPVVMCRCESWIIKKIECWRTDAFELWCWRRLSRVSWTARSNQQF